jgi:DNA-binding NarL/FixJ family response regulator
VTRVVVVDDETMVQEAISIILDAEDDLEVVGTASNGEEVLARIDELLPDVVVMDLRLPGMGGVAATEALNARGLPLSVLALTTFATDEAALDALRAGAAGFCAKADPPDALVRAVRAAANGESVVSPGVLRALLPRLSASKPRLPASCTEREVEVLALVATGANNSEICSRLHISDATVRSHLYHLRSKLDARSRAELVVRAYQLGLS